MKPWITVVAISGAVFFAVLWMTGSCDKPNTPASDETEWRQRVVQLQYQIQERDSLIATIREKRSVDSLKHLLASNELKSREAALVRKLKAANADIQVIADSLPKVARYIELADSTIQIKDSLYIQQVNYGIATEALYRSEIAALATKNIQQVQVSQLLETKVTDLTNQNTKLARKLERKRTGARILGGVAAGLGAALGIVILTSQ